MAEQTYAGKPSSFFATTGGKPVEGAYYSGRRYLGGKLLAVGEHQPGQRVSEEVIAQTAPENVAYVREQRRLEGGTPGTAGSERPTSKEQVTPYLDTFQEGLFQQRELPEVRVPTAEEVKKSLEPTIERPEVIKRTELLEKQRELYGVAELETELSTIKEDELLLRANLREARGIEEGKPVALGVMAGRISEQERQAQTRLDYLNVRKATIVDELNTKYTAINTFVQYAGMDYQDAVKAYDSEFNKNVQVQNMLSGLRKESWTYITDTIQLNEQIKQNNIDNARANLSTITNSITSGGLSMDDLSETERLTIQKLEVQAGLPIGVVSNLKAQVDPQANIVFQTSNQGITQIGCLNPDGTITTKEFGRKISGGGTVTERTAEAKQGAFGEIEQELDRLGGSDKFVSPNEWDYLRRQWIGLGYEGKEFNDAFRTTYVGDPTERKFTIEEFGLE